MGVIWTDQPLGVAGGLTRVDYDWSADELVIEYGLAERRYLKSTQLGITTEQEVCAVGLAENAGGLGGSGDVTEISATSTEQTTDVDMLPRYPGQDVETGTRLMYASDACMIYTAVERQFSLAGNGRPPIPETALNDYLTNYVTTAFLPAYGTNFEIEIPTGAQITSWKQSKPEDDLWTWGVDATYLEASTSPGNSNILTPPSEVTDLIPSDMLCVYANTLRMSKGKNSKATSGWTVTAYPTT